MTRLILFLLLCISIFPENVLASVLAIDYGADWIKASLMKPGVPFDVLLNKDSKRKIQSSVGWKQNDRLFGSDAFAIVSIDQETVQHGSEMFFDRQGDTLWTLFLP